jgi:hypothetical protein
VSAAVGVSRTPRPRDSWPLRLAQSRIGLSGLSAILFTPQAVLLAVARGTRDTPIIVLTGCDLTDADKARLSGRVIDVVHKGHAARQRLARWLAHLHPATQAADDRPGPAAA